MRARSLSLLIWWSPNAEQCHSAWPTLGIQENECRKERSLWRYRNLVLTIFTRAKHRTLTHFCLLHFSKFGNEGMNERVQKLGFGSPLCETVCHYLVRLNIHLSCNPEIPLLGIYPTKVQISCSSKDMNRVVHSSTLHESPSVETNLMSKNSRMDKNCSMGIQWNIPHPWQCKNSSRI